MLFAFTTLLISACTSTKTVGMKVTSDAVQITHLLVIGNDNAKFGSNSAFGPSASSATLETGVKNIFSRLKTQLPLVFQLNGVSAEIQLVSHKVGAKIIPQKTPSHILHLTPTNGTYNQNGNINIELNSNIVEVATNKVIWKGGVKFGKAGRAFIDDKSADDFAKELLIQLKKDGVVSFPTAEPIMPK